MDSPLAHVIYGRFSNKSKSNLNKSILSSKGSWKQVFYLSIETTKEFLWLEDLLSKRVGSSSSNGKLCVLDTYVRLQLINKSDVLCLMCNGFMLTCLGSPAWGVSPVSGLRSGTWTLRRHSVVMITARLMKAEWRQLKLNNRQHRHVCLCWHIQQQREVTLTECLIILLRNR